MVFLQIGLQFILPWFDTKCKARSFRKMKTILKATPHNGARRFGERFCPKRKYGKCGNTGCIFHFSYCTIGSKDPTKPAAPIVRCCLNALRSLSSPPHKRYRAGQGSNEYRPAVHALAVRPADAKTALPCGRTALQCRLIRTSAGSRARRGPWCCSGTGSAHRCPWRRRASPC